MTTETKAERLEFSISTEAWYFTPSTLRDNCTEEIFFGRRVEGDGCKWEACLRWYKFNDGNPPALKVEVFHDAFAAFTESPGFFAALAGLSGKSPGTEEAAALLREHGFADATPRESPNGRPPLRRIQHAAVDLYDSLAEIVAEWGCPNTPMWHRARAALAAARGDKEESNG
jgi:hypothetical protein